MGSDLPGWPELSFVILLVLFLKPCHKELRELGHAFVCEHVCDGSVLAYSSIGAHAWFVFALCSRSLFELQISIEFERNGNSWSDFE